ncbi:thiamine-phosphate kinase [Antrihabitans sp. YC3-6]|uniref:Thiamine-monophosphate kinase n=1 Tax=Antrihabitans stalagmiti TaxID=2799499 RepID=A0A934NVP7_9NOCA|nr:thiamine-phosphate kinase [Antrihabitans stalagmiti]MBJ8342261.1 thiamine-phosphate kinase [Antrihabitans stalagmiti]
MVASTPAERPEPDGSDVDSTLPTVSETSPTVSEIGEFAVIDRATRGRVQAETTIVGPGDDAALVAVADGRVVATTDMLVQGRHFRLDWSTPEQVGRKAIAQSGADVAAMGARPTAYLVSLGCPPATPIAVTDGLTDGLWLEVAVSGGSIVGGDLVQSGQVVISVTALGDLAGRPPVLRSGCRVGDVVAVAGRLGWSAAGLALFGAGIDALPDVLAAHCVPSPPYEQGPIAAAAGATAMADVSDGLVADLNTLAHASGVGIDIRSTDLVVDPELLQAADLVGEHALGWVLGGGEDHALVASFVSRDDVPQGWTVIGVVIEGDGVTVDGASAPNAGGWDSFQR